jgi:hypothetical protein
MKIRSGFVSNSSSSSFICEVCGDTFETYDEGISHFNLVMCDGHDHLFCEAHRINPVINSDGEEDYTMYHDEDESGDGEDRIDAIHCPICQLKEIPENMMLRYALKKLDTWIPGLKKEIQDTFANINEFNDFIRGDGKRYNIELTTHVNVVAPNEELAHRYAREEVKKYPIEMLDVTHCERV